MARSPSAGAGARPASGDGERATEREHGRGRTEPRRLSNRRMASAERRDTTLAKKLPYGRSDPEDGGAEMAPEEEEVDETFLALQRLLKSLNGARSASASNTASTSTNNSLLANSQDAPPSEPDSSAETDPQMSQQRLSREEMLETRRRDRERFRRSLLARGTRRRTCPSYYCSEEEEEDDAPVPSVESTISNRFMNGSFSSLNVHVISRDRWSTEDRVVERLPVVLLPKSGKVSPPTDNKKIKVTHTDEYIDLREKLVENLPEGGNVMHYLTPPRSTWHMQMHDFEELKC